MHILVFNLSRMYSDLRCSSPHPLFREVLRRKMCRVWPSQNGDFFSDHDLCGSFGLIATFIRTDNHHIRSPLPCCLFVYKSQIPLEKINFSRRREDLRRCDLTCTSYPKKYVPEMHSSVETVNRKCGS